MTTRTDTDHDEIDLPTFRLAWAAERAAARRSYEAMRERNPSLPSWGGMAPVLTGGKADCRTTRASGRSDAARARWAAVQGEGA